MKVSGFTIIRNAVRFDFPILEAIQSILPICDEFIIAVGKSEDNTLELIRSLQNRKIKIIETEWNIETSGRNGHVFASETNKALAQVSKDSDWAFYIQADEIVHEKYLEEIHKQMLIWKDTEKVDGLLFNYLHFYGSYDFVGRSFKWYRREVRIIRPDRGIYSHKDAQSFRKNKHEKLNVVHIQPYIYHYGWVREPESMKGKKRFQNQMDALENLNHSPVEFDNYQNVQSLERFQGSHPEVMKERIQKRNWIFDYDISQNHINLKDRFKFLVKKLTGYQVGEFKNWKVIRKSF